MRLLLILKQRNRAYLDFHRYLRENQNMTSNPHILHVITDLNTGGAEMMLYKLLQHPSTIKHSVISLKSKGNIGPKIEALGVPVYALNIHPFSLFSTLKQLRALFSDLTPNIIQGWLVHGQIASLIFKIFFARTSALVWNTRQSYMSSDKWQNHYLSFFSTWSTYRLVDTLIFNSQAGKSYYEGLGFSSKGIIIPNGFNLDLFKPSLQEHNPLKKQLKTTKLLIGNLGRNDAAKDFPTFIRAAALLIKIRNDVHFVLGGKGVTWEDKPLSNLIKELGLSAHISLLGHVSSEEILPFLDLYSLTSCTEAFPNILGEAMASAVPVVVTDAGDAKRIVGGLAPVVPIRNPDALQQAWNEILSLPEFSRKERGKQLRQHIETHYDIQHICKRYDALYWRIYHQNQKKRNQNEP